MDIFDLDQARKPPKVISTSSRLSNLENLTWNKVRRFQQRNLDRFRPECHLIVPSHLDDKGFPVQWQRPALLSRSKSDRFTIRALDNIFVTLACTSCSNLFFSGRSCGILPTLHYLQKMSGLYFQGTLVFALVRAMAHEMRLKGHHGPSLTAGLFLSRLLTRLAYSMQSMQSMALWPMGRSRAPPRPS